MEKLAECNACFYTHTNRKYTLKYYLIKRQAASEKHISLIDSRHNWPGFCFLLFQLSDLVKIILIVLY